MSHRQSLSWFKYLWLVFILFFFSSVFQCACEFHVIKHSSLKPNQTKMNFLLKNWGFMSQSCYMNMHAYNRQEWHCLYKDDEYLANGRVYTVWIRPIARHLLLEMIIWQICLATIWQTIPKTVVIYCNYAGNDCVIPLSGKYHLENDYKNNH